MKKQIFGLLKGLVREAVETALSADTPTTMEPVQTVAAPPQEENVQTVNTAPVTGQVVVRETIDGYAYKENNGEIRITGYNGSETALRIPAEIEGKPVTVIGKNAFAKKMKLVSVIIPDSVKVLDMLCFMQCSNLKSVTLGRQVAVVADGAFSETAIEQITLPDSVKDIGNNAFWGTPISKINIPAGVNAIAMRCFAKTNLTHFTVPGHVKTICTGAFWGNESLMTVLIKEGTAKMDKEIFKGCRMLKSIAIPASVTEIDGDMLDGCKPDAGKLKIYVVAGSTAERVLQAKYASVACFEVVSLANMDGIENMMEADRKEAEADASGQHYYVKLISAKSSTVMAMKVYGDFTGAGLKASKEKIDSAPCILLETASEETAKACLAALQKCNAVVDPDIYTKTINGAE